LACVRNLTGQLSVVAAFDTRRTAMASMVHKINRAISFEKIQNGYPSRGRRAYATHKNNGDTITLYVLEAKSYVIKL
jgi:hypothetical protein